MVSVAERLGAPSQRVRVILADDFHSTVTELLADDGDAAPFTTERIGGIVLAKNLPVRGDPASTYIVFDATHHALDDGVSQAFTVYLVAHEFTHPLLDRLRRDSGALEGVPLPSVTPTECARSIVRCAVDEYRADLVAGIVLGIMASATEADGTLRPVTVRDVIPDHPHAEQVAEALSEVVYPGWPDTVEGYRSHRMSLDSMWAALVSQTDQVMTLLAHAEAEAVAWGEPGTLTSTCADHPGTKMYLGAAWGAVIDALDADRLLPSASNFLEAESAVLRAGEGALFAMWGQLGLTFEERPNREFAIWVTEPTR